MLREGEVRGGEDHPPQPGEEDCGLLRHPSQQEQEDQAVVSSEQASLGGLSGGERPPASLPRPAAIRTLPGNSICSVWENTMVLDSEILGE